jgi:hypothetical protein
MMRWRQPRLRDRAKLRLQERVGQAEPSRVNRGRRILIPRLDIASGPTIFWPHADLVGQCAGLALVPGVRSAAH